MSTATNVRQIKRTAEQVSAENNWQDTLHRWFMPHPEEQMVAQQAKGVFLPYPLLGILVTVGALLLGGIITLEVQVNNLSTTILLRDADQRAEIIALKEKAAQLEVYIHSDREKLVDIQSTLREQDKQKRRN